MRFRSKKIMAAAAMAISAGLVLVGCGAGGSSGDSAGGGTITIGTGGVFTDSNNPFAATSSAVANGWRWLIYEPLVQTNSAVPTDEPEPWLASAYEWAPDFTSVMFTARDGVEWSDGEEFNVDDVAFTFTLLRDNAALNSGNIPIEDVTVDGDSVTVTFGESQFVKQAAVLSQFIVPEHIWADAGDPATYADTQPVGTGPFTFVSSTSSVARLEKNPGYWQADKVLVDAIAYQALQGNDAIINGLAAHELDWASSFALNQNEGFVDKDPDTNLAWNVSALGIDAFVVNTSKAPFDNVNLRRAMSMVIDRERTVQLASGGILAPVLSVTGLPQPVGDEYIAPEFEGQEFSVDVEGARAELAEGGFTFDGDTLIDPSGNPVTMTLIDPSGWTDYLTALQVIGESLAEIGIATTIETPSQDAWQAALAAGDFDGTMRYSDSGPTPYDIYATYMDGTEVEPVGTDVTGNYGRFDSPDATEALALFRNAADETERAEALATVQRVFVEDIPAIAMIAKATTGMFTTVNFTGWPSADNPYASPSILDANISKVMVTLQPAN
ncbi:ABC transporter substrate-binding protein [Microbacterium sp. ET2]|uniref:ABC transporter substrate-binding protein n=1 Tax=Microbacterium albipurpureum TaxID=3050384 RepID=UPI00259CF11E|nr:ABC transporter substrate-binding protein [Microbacterium sp. ET2 (Ac-2212)]WJL97012.1 ABC transporter substrate-binding protein [Microbacterium sp. ET2 (Ac-2212)]